MNKYGSMMSDADWASQPVVLRALGRVAGEKAFFEWMDSRAEEIFRQSDARRAAMSPEEIIESESRAREKVYAVIHASAERDELSRWGRTR